MSWTRRAVVLLSVVISTAGCRMCAHPFDYCSPVVEGGRSACGPRAGSILSEKGPYCKGMCAPCDTDQGAPLPEGLAAHDGAAEEIFVSAREGDIPPLDAKEGTVRVLSVSERALKVPSAAEVPDDSLADRTTNHEIERMDDPAVPTVMPPRHAGKWMAAKRNRAMLQPGPGEEQ
jgi:hypothetical protein